MNRLLFILGLAALCSACGNSNRNEGDSDIYLEEQNAQSLAYTLSSELAQSIADAQSYEEFKAARTNLLKYDAAFGDQIGGEYYTIFIEECNYILDEI